jgi:hypothetical protein
MILGLAGGGRRKLSPSHSISLYGLVQANVGQNVTLLTIPLRLFFTIFLGE